MRAFLRPRTSCRPVLLSLVLACCQQSPAQTTNLESVLAPAGTIPLDGVEGRFDHLSVDLAAGRLFVAALENHTVEIVDLGARRRVRQLTGISEPQGVLFVPEKRRLLICGRGDGTCRSFSTIDFSEGPWVDVGRNADNVRFDPATQIVYIGSAGEPGPGLMTGIDLVSLLPPNEGGQPAPPHSPADFWLDRPRQADPKMEVQLSAHPESFQFDPQGQRLLVNVPDTHEITVINLRTNEMKVSAHWPVTTGEKNFPMAFAGSAHGLFIACRRPPKLAAFDANDGRLLCEVPCVGDADDMFYDAARGRLYVIGGEGFVDVFQAAEGGRRLTRLQRLVTAPRARTGLFIPELGLLAVAAPHTTNGPAAIQLYRTAN